MEMVPLVPALVVVLEEGLEVPGADDGVGEATAAEVLSEHVGAASASGRADKRESAAASMTEEENGKEKKDREGGREDEEDWTGLECTFFCTLGVKKFHCSAQLSSTCLLLAAKWEQAYHFI